MSAIVIEKFAICDWKIKNLWLEKKYLLQNNALKLSLRTLAYCSKDTTHCSKETVYYEFNYPKSYPKFDIPIFTLLYPPR